MEKIAKVGVVLAAVVACGAASAGTYVKGFGSTAKEATENAILAAEAAVKSRPTGCVGAGADGKTEATRFVSHQEGVWVIEAHYNHHDGSCHKKKTILDNLRDMGLGG